MHSTAQLVGLVLAIVCVSMAGGLYAGGVALGLAIVLVSTALESGRR
jgi:hypothetical protein